LNIVDKLTNRNDDAASVEFKMRHDVLYTQLRASTGLAPENIDLSEVDFTISDDDLRAQVAKARGITSETAIAEIDLDEVLAPSGSIRRRARRAGLRAEARRRAKGQMRFRRNQAAQRRKRISQPSGHDKVVAHRARKAQQDQVAALIKDGLDPRAAYDQVVGASA
jgi:hypothetical protein